MTGNLGYYKEFTHEDGYKLADLFFTRVMDNVFHMTVNIRGEHFPFTIDLRIQDDKMDEIISEFGVGPFRFGNDLSRVIIEVNDRGTKAAVNRLEGPGGRWVFFSHGGGQYASITMQERFFNFVAQAYREFAGSSQKNFSK